MRITSGGNVGIGTTSPTYFLDVLSSSVSTARFKDSARFCLVTLESSGTNQSSYLEFKPTGTGTAIIQFNGSTALTAIGVTYHVGGLVVAVVATVYGTLTVPVRYAGL
jgi:hypothetical protein